MLYNITGIGLEKYSNVLEKSLKIFPKAVATLRITTATTV